MTKKRELAKSIAQRLKSLRKEAGLTADEFAGAARRAGLDWQRTTVVDLELGRRDLTASELLLLPYVAFSARLRREDGRILNLEDLLPADGWIEVAEGARVRAEAFRLVAEGKHEEGSPHWFDTPGQRAATSARDRWLERVKDEVRAIARVWEDFDFNDLAAAEEAAAGEAEQVAARKFNVTPKTVSVAAFVLWKRGFTAERDERVTEQATEDASPRSLQALRGHVTRDLYKELGPTIDKLTEAQNGEH